MKKFLALMLAMLLALSLVACGGSDATVGGEAGDGDHAYAPTSALDLLTVVWDAYGGEKFAAVGGGPEMENKVEDAPAAFDLTDRTLAEVNLVLPQSAEVDEAASLVHMMNANTFTAAAYHATGDTAALAETLRDAVQGNQWMCGFPDKVAVAVVGEYVLVVFGGQEQVDTFMGVYGGICGASTVVYDEAVAA